MPNWHRIRLQPKYRDITHLDWFKGEKAPPNIHCVHCTLSIDGPIFPIPIRRLLPTKKFEVLGGCGTCSMSCLRGLIHNPRVTGLNVGLNLTLLKDMLRQVYGLTRKQIRDIKTAPPITAMKRYGGVLTDQGYRNYCRQGDRKENSIHSISVIAGELVHVTPMYVKEMKRKRVEEKNEMIAKLAQDQKKIKWTNNTKGNSPMTTTKKKRKNIDNRRGLMRFMS